MGLIDKVEGDEKEKRKEEGRETERVEKNSCTGEIKIYEAWERINKE